MKYVDKEGGFCYVFIDEIPLEYQDTFIMFLLGQTIPIPIDGRKRAYWGDYKNWWYYKLD